MTGGATRWLRSTLGAATLLMLGLSWPLWVGDGEIPRVPFIRDFPGPAGTAGWLTTSALAASLAAFAGSSRWRLGYAASLGLFVVLFLGDQHRFQAWAYQYLMVGLALAALPGGGGIRYARYWMISLYVHSGLSKLDRSFGDELGPVFLGTLLRPAGLDPWSLPDAARRAAVLALPAAELLAALALLVPRSRLPGLVAITLMHVSLILLLGPLGLGHSGIVQVWNAAMVVEVWILFAAIDDRAEDLAAGGAGGGVVGGVARAAMVAGMLLPFGERRGYFDAWPSHALYASHVERLTVDIHDASLGSFPDSIRRNVRPLGDGPWHRLDLTAWSRQSRGTPPYPSNRAGLGLAEGLAARYGGPSNVRAILLGRADRWTGRRPRTDLVGLDAIRRRGERYRLNAHPAADPE